MEFLGNRAVRSRPALVRSWAHTGNAAAFEFLANPNNLHIPIYSRATTLKKTEAEKEVSDSVPGDDPAICRVKDCLSQIYQHLELIMAHQAEAQTQPGISLRPKSVFRETLEGFDFMDVVHHEETRARLATLKKADGGWVKFTREIGATILFGGGFGDLFQPKSGIENGSSCLLHSSVPKGENYLAACVTDLLSIIKNNGDISPRSRLLIK
ncbi:hypothetical protein CPAR01_01674 [Colletotrichum paranaense]|uniref:Uncharacterized protein n=1 Tax=Colletotrichum paranaense TaxID=1914294 RepID=A0ABQ9T7F4_9PEZI|nr:uncharacterized protein CPAR01_01674 [Colletotrichum paranaense]KAK1547707.1 hypothetical protein CPAR01_01674 [Colletotrichum paranaense]